MTIKRYNLKLPQPLYEQLEAVAQARQVPVVDVIRLYLNLGLLLEKENYTIQKVCEDGSTRQVELLY